jgi:hypothetical protein
LICFFHNWNWLSSEGAFIDQGTALQDNSLKGQFNWIF